jgi:hypothetical protein
MLTVDMVVLQPVFIYFWAMSWLRQFVAGLSPQRLGFSARSFHVAFVVNKVTLG